MNPILRTLVVLFLLLTQSLKSQLSGTYSVPATYSTIADAITDLNTQGVNGPVTILVSSGHTETAPVGGYNLSATGTSANPIVFQKNGAGANPLISAYTGGNGTPATALQDGIWRFSGSDYVTIDGISLVDPNTTNSATMEYGFGFFKSTNTDGCQHNTVKNCVITLRRVNNVAGSGPASEGSRGIDVVNAVAAAHTTSVLVTAASGANSFNHFYNNIIQNCNIGIAIIGFEDASPFTSADYDNDIGGLSSVTSNTILNFGGGTSSQIAYGIKTAFQYNSNVSYNYLNSNDGSGTNHNAGLYGIYLGTATSADITINSNTVSLKGSGTTAVHYGIINYAGGGLSSNLVSIENNLITKCSYTTSTTGYFQGIINAADASTVNVNYNSVTNNTCSPNSSGYYCIINSGLAENVTMHGNQAYDIFFTNVAAFPRFSFITGRAASIGGTLTVSSNSLSNINFISSGNGAFLGVDLAGSPEAESTNIINNVFGNLTIPTDGIVALIRQFNGCANTLVSGNRTTGLINCSGSGNNVYGYDRNGHPTVGTSTIISNDFSNITTNLKDFRGISYNATSNQHSVSILSNTISNISSANYETTGIFLGSGNSCSIKGNMISAFTCSASFVYGYYQDGNSDVDFAQNKISDLSGNLGSQVFGIYINSGLTTNLSNNIIGNLNASNSSYSNAVNGICIEGGSTTNVFYNTVRLNASSTGINFGSSALYASITPTVNLRNTILINLSSQTGTGTSVAYRRSGADLSSYSSLSNSNLFYAGTPSANNLLFSDGTNMHQSITAFKTFVSPFENLSLTENTPFLSTTGSSNNFLHIDPVALSLTESNALAISGYSIDYDSNIRQGNTGYAGTGLAPDIGADEFEGIFPNCTSVNTPTISVLSSSICVGQAAALNSNPEAPYPGVVRQWLEATNPTGPYSPVSGANGLAYTNSTLTPGTHYYIFVNTCTITNVTYTSNVISVLVSAYPIVTVSPVTSTLCTGGDPITLNASGATSYSWSPLTGLSSGSLAVITASPANTTTYVVTGINPGNCTHTASTIVYRLPTAGGLTVTPSSTTICQGYNVNFQTVSTNTAYAVAPITFSPIPTPAFGVTTLCNNGSVVTWTGLFGGLDDGVWNNLPLPFTFTFFETPYTAFTLGTNGVVVPGIGANTIVGYALPLPDPNAAAPCIGAVYSDLEFSYSGSISTFTTGTAPNRRVVINWENGRYYTNVSGTGTVTTQMILYETSNDIEVHTTIASGASSSVEGIQNSTGTQAFMVPGRNTSFFNVTNDAYRWSIVKNVNWQPSNYLNLTSSLTPTAINVQGNIVYTVSATTGNGCTVTTTASVSVIPSPTLSISSVSVPVCAGTSLSLNVSGANTFTWNTGVQSATLNVAPVLTTTYTASGTGTLNSCIGRASAIVTVMPNPNLVIAGSRSLCEGYTQTYSVSGADTYTWNTGSTIPSLTVTAVTNSVFTIAVTNTLTSCTASAQLSISVYPNPTVSISGSSLICSGKSATLNASGGNIYIWVNGPFAPSYFPTPLATTVYSVVGLLGPPNCSNTAAFTVSVIPSPTLSVNNPAPICAGESVNLSASGANTYTWTTGAFTNSIAVSPVSTNNYSVSGIGTLNSCIGSTIVTVNVNPLPTLSIEVVPSATICEGESVELAGKSNTIVTYLWSDASVSSTITVTPAITTTYSLSATNVSNGCKANATMEITVDPCTSLGVYTKDEISVYPNPAENVVFVKNMSTKEITYELGDINGRILLKGNLHENKNSILLDGLAKGIYYLRIKGDENFVLKIVKL